MVVYDDADLEPWGVSASGPRGEPWWTQRNQVDHGRDREQGSSPAIRLGVRGEGRQTRWSLADYVLEAFDPEEVPVSERLVQSGADAEIRRHTG